jgi:hypothetical protein
MDVFVIATIMLGIWAALGPIVGIYLGAYISNRNQRKQWLSDCKKEEYSELISALAKSALTLTNMPSVRGEQEQRAELDARKHVGEVAFAKIFIAPTIQSLKVTKRWQEAVSCGDIRKFAVLTGQLLEEIREEAIKDISSGL